MKKNNQQNNPKVYPQDFKSYQELSKEKILLSSLHQDLQNFSRQISYLSALHTNGKMSTATVCHRLQSLWQSLNSFNN